jgi:uncharacterized membrane protein YtjA (UPF0391 family)
MLYNAGSIPVLLFAGVITDTLGIATVLYSLGVVILLFQWWASRPWRQRGGPALASDQSTPSETDHRLSP